MSKSIRVYYSQSETGQADLLTEDTAELTNIPFDSKKVNYKDIVRVKKLEDTDLHEIIEILEQKSWTRRLLYPTGEYQEVRKYFQSKNIQTEGFKDTIACLAIPMNIAIKELYEIAKGCPVKVEVRPDQARQLEYPELAQYFKD